MENPLQILYFSGNPEYAEPLNRLLEKQGINSRLNIATTFSDYADRLRKGGFDVVLCDDSASQGDGLMAFDSAQQAGLPFILMAEGLDPHTIGRLRTAPAADYVLQSQLWRLAPAVQRLSDKSNPVSRQGMAPGRGRGMERLVGAIQELSLARNLADIMGIVRRAAREVTGADGATFILQENGQCYYADEDAIAPLWKGRRFPLNACISGWVMQNRQPAVIQDIYSDPRIPLEAYRPTFVKSLVMVPIRMISPVGAIGNYWADRRSVGPEEVRFLQTLADSTSVAMENVRLYQELEQCVRDRTAQLEATNRELEAFSFSVSHDLRAPLRSVDGFSRALQEEYADKLDETGRKYLERVRFSSGLMSEMIHDMLGLSRVTRQEMRHETVFLTDLAREIMEDLRRSDPERNVDFILADGLTVQGDPGLLRVVLQNLLENAWKYTSKLPRARIEFASCDRNGSSERASVFFVRDNGAGFDMKFADKLFSPFQRLHLREEFEGSGVGLATVERIIRRHGGRIWPEAAENQGATFYFTVGGQPSGCVSP